LVVHIATHCDGPQTKGAHACVCTAGHLPVPLHAAASVATFAAQLGARQRVVVLG
jgi:hypothetical protein